jgi:hypothetical protein
LNELIASFHPYTPRFSIGCEAVKDEPR